MNEIFVLLQVRGKRIEIMVGPRCNKYFGLLLIALHMVAFLAVGDKSAKRTEIQDHESEKKERKDKGL
jgi:hypothetical protein